ncbi:hypothetical protein SASPL_128715 [Salvia splendens]|uniref:TFIID subunit TAF5 NTD2 domain-containing protein n=1 Tax=Salvia splendens TaxID=180675 RepID=A0A8X8XBU1_SALSN|nr:hypothetical protein SASPL_128715 [Salvia splendens]
MDQEEIDKVVLAYLDKRGFKQAGLVLQQEKQQSSSKGSNASSTAQIDPDIAKQILSFSEVDGPAQYQEGYSKLRSWAYSSLDQYQVINASVLMVLIAFCTSNRLLPFPCFAVMCNLLKSSLAFQLDLFLIAFEEIMKLCTYEMEFAHSLRQKKAGIKICQYSYDLLLQYLHKSQSITMLGIVNEHINFQVSPGQPNSIADDAEYVSFFGGDQDTANLLNQKEIHWGLLEDSLEERLEKIDAPSMDFEMADVEAREGELEENKKRSDVKQGTTTKKLKKDKVAGATAKAHRSDSVTAPCVKPELAQPVMYI